MKLSIKDLLIFTLLTVTMELALIWALQIAPPDRMQGDVQRIFYFHLGSIWPGFLAFFYVMYGSARYLAGRDLHWDRKSLASGEIGLVFCTIVLTTGPIWAKPTWGVWWSWDARLTSTVVLWLIFLGYINLRHYIDDESKRPRISAILGIVGACVVPFVYMSTRLFETQHPKPVIMGDEDSGIKDPNMTIALVLAMAAFTLLYICLWRIAVTQFQARDRLDKLKTRLSLLEDEY
ncbi:Heme exporter protein C [Sulfidibacter corallicola]|uniref:Heme exporter protein C n=1 Tax=Sulfidibacter corallicola TaxID=2818388 RepID=A0A8A4TRU0_SULCO|nr:cytochrome c biogenesis protein CcsA [Sulfidibacter corallicola]QTD52233.1 cytochrome c biogenesis protein CcsA [Sulfidibacter corallicola]